MTPPAEAGRDGKAIRQQVLRNGTFGPREKRNGTGNVKHEFDAKTVHRRAFL